MTFNLTEFFVAVAGIIVGAYILNYFGYLKHSSPMSLYGPTGSRNGTKYVPKTNGTTGVRSIPSATPRTNPTAAVSVQPSVSRGDIGATELSGRVLIR